MIRILWCVLGCLPLPVLQAQEPAAGVYELRVYTVQPEKLQVTHTFIRQVALPYWNKYQLKLIGAWSPVDTGDTRIFLLVSHESKEACQKNWEALQNDSQWNRDLEVFRQEGAPVTGITRIFLKILDYSPQMTPAVVGNRLFELRTYLASEGNLARLNNRFRKHTLKLFEKHGMTNLGYFQVATDDKLTCGDLMKACSAPGKDGTGVKPETPADEYALVYFLSHASVEAMQKSFGSFRVDPAWRSALTESEKEAGGPLTAKDAVKSLVLRATDYSPLR